jgi:hypothetical protein
MSKAHVGLVQHHLRTRKKKNQMNIKHTQEGISCGHKPVGLEEEGASQHDTIQHTKSWPSQILLDFLLHQGPAGQSPYLPPNTTHHTGFDSHAPQWHAADQKYP